MQKNRILLLSIVTACLISISSCGPSSVDYENTTSEPIEEESKASTPKATPTPTETPTPTPTETPTPTPTPAQPTSKPSTIVGSAINSIQTDTGELLNDNGIVLGIPWYSKYSELPSTLKNLGQYQVRGDLSYFICNDVGKWNGTNGSHVSVGMAFGGSDSNATLDTINLTVTRDDSCAYSNVDLSNAVVIDLMKLFGDNFQATSSNGAIWNLDSGVTVMFNYDENKNANIGLAVAHN